MGVADRRFRIGIDLGGTKIEGLVLGPNDEIAAGPLRLPTPRDDYEGTLLAIAQLVTELEGKLGAVPADATGSLPDAPAETRPTVGMGMPGSITKSTGLVQNANSTWLNGRPLQADLERTLGRPVRLANDANCFALSEARDGSGASARTVFGVILGTGCGGGLVIGGALLDGPLGIGGEWGHNPLPWPSLEELNAPRCWCGRRGCMETWVSGPALERLYHEACGVQQSAREIGNLASAGDDCARIVLDQHLDRLGRGLAHVVNLIDPDVVVLGGGLSNLTHLYEDLAAAITPHLFADQAHVDIRAPRWGDSSGVRGAARLWD